MLTLGQDNFDIIWSNERKTKSQIKTAAELEVKPLEPKVTGHRTMKSGNHNYK